MKQRVFAVSIAVAIVLLLTVIGCIALLGGTSFVPIGSKIKPVENAREIYARAIEPIDSSADTALSISKTLQTALDGEVFTESTRQNLVYTGLGTADFYAESEELLSIDEHTVIIREKFHNGTGYAAINDSFFSSTISSEEYQKQLIPAILLDAALYESIFGLKYDDVNLIIFQNPIAPENWALDETAEFLAARGVACIDRDGTLVSSTYAVTYRKGDATIHLTVTCDTTASDVTISAPENPSQYTNIAYLDGPRMLEQATGYLLQAKNITALYNDRSYCQAFGDEREREITLRTFSSENWSAQVDTNTALSNTGRVGDITQHLHSETFQNNTYTISVDGSEPTENPAIDLAAMQIYCKDLLVNTIMLPEYISDVTYTETGSSLLISFTANGDLADQISNNTCQSLYQDPELLKNLAEGYSTDIMQCYLELDKYTGLPVSAGVDYCGSYNIEGISYQLQFEADQLYKFQAPTA